MVRRAKLTPEEEKAIALLWENYFQSECDESRNDLVEHYRPVAISVARSVKKRLPRTVDMGDLEGAGDIGLIQAVERFDPERGVPFEAFCSQRVHGAILDELRRHDWLPRPVRKRLKARKQVVGQLSQELGREPLEEEIAAALEMSLEDYRHYFGNGKDTPVLAGGRPANGAQDGQHGLDFLEDPRAEDHPDPVHVREMLELIRCHIEPEAREILFMKYFLGYSLKEIGQELDLSLSRVCKIHGRIVERLQERFGSKV